MTTPRQQRIARASIIAIGVTAIAALALFTYADARRVMAERATAKATTPQVEQPLSADGLSADQAARLARALSTTRIDGATIIYVDDDASPGGNGASWATAFNDLWDGMMAAHNLGGAPAEIWVAGGTYKPDQGTGDRDLSFVLFPNTGIYGGFAGDEVDFSDRDFQANQTTLSGDLLGDDVGFTGMGENSKRIVYVPSVDSTGVLDGFTITGAYSGPAIDVFGDGPTTIRSCVIERNVNFNDGGGMVVASNPCIVDCVIRDNRADGDGGGIYVWGGHPLISNCTFAGNTAQGGGGGAYVYIGNAVFVNCLFARNAAGKSGGGCVNYGSPTGRSTPPPSYSTWINCTFYANTASKSAGGISAQSGYGEALITNCVLWNNSDRDGVSEEAQIATGMTPFEVSHSCVMGWSGVLGGVGNHGLNPRFVDPANGDYRLGGFSPCIDAGDDRAITPLASTDLVGNPRFIDHPTIPDVGVSTTGLPVVDMGALEWVGLDCNENGVLDINDLAAGTSQDVDSDGTPDECEPDCNSNGLPDDCDLAQGVDFDCNSNGVPDECDVAGGESTDCNGNFVPDECESDCNGNGVDDACDIAANTSWDCNDNTVPDECDPGDSTAQDDCEDAEFICPGARYVGTTLGMTRDGSSTFISGSYSVDVWYLYEPAWSGSATVHLCFDVSYDSFLSLHSGCPGTANNEITYDDDGCDALGGGAKLDFDVTGGETYVIRVAGFGGDQGDYALTLIGPDCVSSPSDCNSNGTPDVCDIAQGTSHDLNTNGRPDECEVDCNSNGWPDDYDIAQGVDSDCNGNTVPDECDIESGASRDCNSNGAPDECDGDCNLNGYFDGCDLAAGTSRDCNTNSLPDECDIAAGTATDCDASGTPDSCDIAAGSAQDCNTNGQPDDCDIANTVEQDCNGNSVPDSCDIASSTSTDLNTNGIPDDCEPDCNGNAVPDDHDLAIGTSSDCNANAIPDECDVDAGTSADCNGNVIPDACEPDCNANGTPDDCDLTAGTAADCNGNVVPDECDLAAGTSRDCNGNGIPDTCDLAAGTSRDCNTNAVPDVCDIAAGTSADCNENGAPDDCDLAGGTSKDCNDNLLPDSCEPDCNANGTPDDCDVAAGTSPDCNGNTAPDACDIATGTSADCNQNAAPDECDLADGTSEDCNGNAIPDECDLAGSTSDDCNTNGLLDECEIVSGTTPDCNENGIPDACDYRNEFTGISPTFPARLNSNAAWEYVIDRHPQITTNRAGLWICVWESWDSLGGTLGSDADILVSRSTDDSAHWTPSVALNSNASSDARNDQHPQLTTDGLGNWIAVWDSSDSLGGTIGTDYDILISRSTDDGLSWTSPTPLNGNADSDSGTDQMPQLATDSAGNWVAVWRSDDTLSGTLGTDSDILVARSVDNGLTWTLPTALNSNAASDAGGDYVPQVATDRAGNWLAVWASLDDLGGTIGGDYDILVSRSIDCGATWTPPAALNANAAADSGDDNWPQVSTDARGNWVAVWGSADNLGGTIGNDRDVLVSRSANNGLTWTPPSALNTQADSDSGDDEWPQVTTDEAGNWVVVWHSYYNLGGTIGSDADILAAHSADNGLSWSSEVVLNLNAYSDADGDAWPQSTTDGAGKWVVAWASENSLDGTIGSDFDILFTRFRFGPLLDCNHNGVLDECDADCDGNGTPDQCELAGDMNHDGFVDGADIDAYLACLTGPCAEDGACLPPLYLDECCAAADGDFDGDVDLNDFWSLQQVFDRVCYVDRDCDDGLFCTGVETCVGGLCQAGSYPCTDPVYSVCLEDTDACTYPPLSGMSDDFESYACGGEPEFWFDTEAGGSLVHNDALFDVACLGNTQAFHTASTATNIHSHYTQLGSTDWSANTYTGRMMIDNANGGIGVTFMSQFPDAPLYYRLRRYQWGQAFQISPTDGVAIPQGDINTDVVPIPNVWYRFRIEVADTGTQTEIRAKVWRESEQEPASWQVDCYDDTPTRLTHGTVGVWSMGPDNKYWDDIAVSVPEP